MLYDIPNTEDDTCSHYTMVHAALCSQLIEMTGGGAYVVVKVASVTVVTNRTLLMEMIMAELFST